ncbi:MAG: DNA repair protein RecO [Magnetococcales bacterium]|nr:DNA repair protein RecO [Magnetococcales bacterium]
MRIHDQGLVLRRTPYGEASLVVQFFTRGQGVLGVLARGIRGRKRPERAALAGFHDLDLWAGRRAPAALATLTGVEIARPRHRLGRDGRATAAAQVIQEVLVRLLPPGDPHHRLFQYTAAALDRLDAGAEALALLGWWQGWALRELGFGWRLDACAGCGGPVTGGYFSVRRAQGVCPACGAPYRERLVPLSPALEQAMARLEWPGAFDILSPGERSRLFGIGSAGLSRFGGRRLSAPVWFGRSAGLDPHTLQRLIGERP